MRFGTFRDIRIASIGHAGNCSTHVHQVLNWFSCFNQQMNIFVCVKSLPNYRECFNSLISSLRYLTDDSGASDLDVVQSATLEVFELMCSNSGERIVGTFKFIKVVIRHLIKSNQQIWAWLEWTASCPIENDSISVINHTTFWLAPTAAVHRFSAHNGVSKSGEYSIRLKVVLQTDIGFT